MAASFSFNGTDLSTYGLHCGYPLISKAQEISYAQLYRRARKIGVTVPPIEIALECDVTAASHSALVTALDSIRAVLDTDEECNLAIDIISGRYWKTYFKNIMPIEETAVSWTGMIIFLALDPAAYASSETDNDYNVDADPDTIVEAAGGNYEIEPVFTLAAGENLTDVTIILENDTTGEALTWDGSMSNTDTLEIDVVNKVVKLEGDAEDGMAGLDPTSDFPRLEPNTNNSIIVTGFGSLGSLNITYRNRYA